MKKKATIAVVALALVLCFAIGGTLAWLKAETKSVVNTFTYGDINIDLSETTGEKYKMIPGNPIDKDPTVTVEANSEDCWLFVKIEKSDNFDDFMTYSIADGWTRLTEDTKGNAISDLIYWREVDASNEQQAFEVLEDNEVSVLGTVTKDNLNALDANGTSNYPTLTFTAYAVQRDTNITTAAQAWDIAMGNN